MHISMHNAVLTFHHKQINKTDTVGCHSGHTGWESLHALHSPLNVKQLLQPTSKFAQEVAAAWSGDILLLSTEMLTSNSSTTSNVFPPKASLSAMGQADHSLRLQSLCESLQHARMAACLK